MRVTEALQDAGRAMQVCNACRYCEGFCAVFPAMERRREFADTDLTYLANLCHNCRACFYACQYAPPHEFGVNLPRTLAELRAETWEEYAWPGFLARLFRRNGTVVASRRPSASPCCCSSPGGCATRPWSTAFTPGPAPSTSSSLPGPW